MTEKENKIQHCGICGRELGTELDICIPVYDEEKEKEVYLCAACHNKIKWEDA